MATAKDLGFEISPESTVSAEELGFEIAPEQRVQEPSMQFPGGAIETPEGQFRLRSDKARAAQLDEVKQALGGNVSDEPLSDFGLVFDLARSDKPEEKKQKFLSKFPEGEISFIPTREGTVMAARTTPSEEFKVVDNNVAEITQSLANMETVGAVGGALLGGPSAGFMGILTRLGFTGAGATGGGILESEVERARGFEEETRQEAVSESIGLGLTVSAFDGLTMGLGKVASPLVRKVTGAGIGKGISEQQLIRNAELGKTIEATEMLGLPPLARGQVGISPFNASPHPLVQGMFFQSAGTSARPREVLKTGQSAMRRRLQELSESDYESFSDAELGRVIRDHTRELNRIVDAPPTSVEAAGEAGQTIVNNYRNSMREAKNRLYQQAFDVDDTVSFDLRSTKEVAEAVRNRTPAPRAAGGETRIGGKPRAPVTQVLRELDEVPDTLTKYNAEDGSIVTGYEQLAAIRTQLFDAKQSDHGPTRRAANMLWNSLSDSMDSPIGGTKAFTDAFKKARAANRIMEANLEKKVAKDFLNSEEPGKVAQRYIRYDSPIALRNIRNMAMQTEGGRGQWETMKNHFVHRLVDDPASGLKEFRRWERNPKALSLLVPSSQKRRALRTRLEAEAKLMDSPFKRIADKEETAGERVIELMRSGTAGQMQELVRRAGGKNSEMARDMKAGLYRRILEQSEVSLEDTGERVIRADLLDNSVKKFQQSEVVDALMTEADKKVLDNIRRWAAVNRGDIDAGGQIVAAQVRSGLSEPGRAARALYKVGSFSLIAHALSRPALRKKLSQKQNWDIDKIRGVTQVIRSINQDELGGVLPQQYTPSFLREEERQGATP